MILLYLQQSLLYMYLLNHLLLNFRINIYILYNMLFLLIYIIILLLLMQNTSKNTLYFLILTLYNIYIYTANVPIIILVNINAIIIESIK